MKNMNPIELSEYGSTLERQQSLEHRSVREFFTVGVILTLFFVLVDFTKLFITWNTVQTESWYFVALLALACAVILDVPMMVAGTTIKGYKHGLNSRKEMLIALVLSIAAFLIIYVPSLKFSIVTMDATFQAPSSVATQNRAGYVSPSGDTEENTAAVLVAAVYAGIIPLGTSIASLVIGLYTSDPLGTKLNKIRAARTKANYHRMNLNQILAEEESLIDRQNLLIAHEKDLAVQFVQEAYSQEAVRIQAFLEALEEKCDQDGISTIIEYAQEVIKAHEFSDQMSEETAKALDAYCPLGLLPECDNLSDAA